MTSSARARPIFKRPPRSLQQSQSCSVSFRRVNVAVSPPAKPQETTSYLHKFALWDTFTEEQKLSFLFGFSNGFFAGPRPRGFEPLLDCMEKNATTSQAIAMIDKFYKSNPERWGLPIGNGVVLSLKVTAGPCAGIDPWISQR